MRVKITSLVRLTNSQSGNPRYLLHTSAGCVLHTKADSTIGYVAQSLEQFLLDGAESVTVDLCIDREGAVTKLLGYGEDI